MSLVLEECSSIPVSSEHPEKSTTCNICHFPGCKYSHYSRHWETSVTVETSVTMEVGQGVCGSADKDSVLQCCVVMVLGLFETQHKPNRNNNTMNRRVLTLDQRSWELRAKVAQQAKGHSLCPAFPKWGVELKCWNTSGDTGRWSSTTCLPQALLPHTGDSLALISTLGPQRW